MNIARTFKGAAAAMMLAALPAVTHAAPSVVTPSVSHEEMRRYASALFQILSVRRVAESRWKAASPAEHASLRGQTQAAIETILARFGFDEAGFNRISSEVERKPALRRDVRRYMMQEGLGF